MLLERRSSGGIAFACRLCRNRNQAAKRIINPRTSSTIEIPIPALAPELILKDGPGVLVGPGDEVFEIIELETEVVVVPAGLASTNPLTCTAQTV
jgi:hypothetical protein